MGKSVKVPKKKPSKQATPRERLEQELIGMIEQIDEEGLVFLARQAHVLIHNRQVDNINRAVDELQQDRTEATERKVPAAAAVRIEDAGGKAFIMVIEGARKMLSLEEMRSLVKICYAAEDASDGAGRLFNWLSKDRKDVLIDAAIGRRAHPALEALYKYIKSQYKPKD